MSPPLADQGPTQGQYHTQRQAEQDNEITWVTNQHITGLAISTNKLCGEANYVQHGDCTVCGKSYAMIQEEMTLGDLEQTHVPGETYAQRIRRRDAFEAGMRAASVILVPGGVSQAAACDGIFYQIPGNSALNPHQEYYQSNQQWTIGTNAYKQYMLLLHCKLTSHIFELKSIWLQQSFVLIKRITSHF